LDLGRDLVLPSTDEGLTWKAPVRLTGPEPAASRPAVGACGRYVHVAWVDKRAARQKPPWDWDIYYKRSTDGGVTWEPTVRMTDTPWHTRHPQVAALSHGRVCCLWEDGTAWDGRTSSGWSGDGALYAALSSDNGASWQKAKRFTFVNSPRGRATHAKSFAAGSRIFVVWTAAEEGCSQEPVGARAAYFCSSADGGLTWGPAERLAAKESGDWASHGVAGTDSAAIATVGVGMSIHATLRRGGECPGRGSR